MIFSEPPRTQFDLNFMLGRVPVRVHPLFWVFTVLLVYGSRSKPVTVLIWVVAVFVSIVLHEMGHVLAFRRFGFNAHIVLHGFGGLAIPDSARGFRVDTPLSRVIIALAGPFAQLLLLGLIVLGLMVFDIAAPLDFMFFTVWINGHRTFDSPQLGLLVDDLLFVNACWPVLNLLPIYPLDGSRVFRELLARFNPHDGDRQLFILSTFTAVAIAIVAFTRWHLTYTALFFGYLAYMSYVMLESSGGFGRRRW